MRWGPGRVDFCLHDLEGGDCVCWGVGSRDEHTDTHNAHTFIDISNATLRAGALTSRLHHRSLWEGASSNAMANGPLHNPSGHDRLAVSGRWRDVTSTERLSEFQK